jgi:hypothetical protein
LTLQPSVVTANVVAFAVYSAICFAVFLLSVGSLLSGSHAMG